MSAPQETFTLKHMSIVGVVIVIISLTQVCFYKQQVDFIPSYIVSHCLNLRLAWPVQCPVLPIGKSDLGGLGSLPLSRAALQSFPSTGKNAIRKCIPRPMLSNMQIYTGALSS